MPERVTALAAGFAQPARLGLSIDTQCTSAFPYCLPASARGSVTFCKSTAANRPESMNLSLNAGPTFAKSPWHYCPTALTHVLVNGFGWQRTAAPLAPQLQRRTETFFPDCAALVSSRDKKAPVRRPPLRFGPAGATGASPCLKPAIEAANERGVRPPQGEVSWQISAHSKSPATPTTPARSSR